MESPLSGLSPDVEWRSRVRSRTQSSLAVSADGEGWLVLSASPDIRMQIAQTTDLLPQAGSWHSPIQAALLTSTEIGHVAGLLTLRTRQTFTLFATCKTSDTLALNPIFDALAPELVARHPVRLGQSFVHINNTNPALVEDSDERRLVERGGWIVAHDGLRILP